MEYAVGGIIFMWLFYRPLLRLFGLSAYKGLESGSVWFYSASEQLEQSVDSNAKEKMLKEYEAIYGEKYINPMKTNKSTKA